MDGEPMMEFRCPTVGCGKLLFKCLAVEGIEVETRCPRCKSTVVARLETDGAAPAAAAA